jgi:hypothetical protein
MRQVRINRKCIGGHMMILMLRLILLALIIFFFNIIFKSIFSSNRRFNHACTHKRYYLVDDKENIRKNFILTYKGAVFEGEKFPGTAEDSREVISILLWIHDPAALIEMGKADFLFIEQKIHEQYPLAKINWKHPINDLKEKSLR